MSALPALPLRWRRAWPTALLGVGAIAVGAVLLRFNPNAAGNPLPACPFHAVTGLYCPGCGSTRALHALVHGDVATALAMNPLLVISLPLLAWMALDAAGLRLPGATRMRTVIGNPKLWLVALCSYWLARNLPWPPFNWLAPGGFPGL